MKRRKLVLEGEMHPLAVVPEEPCKSIFVDLEKLDVNQLATELQYLAWVLRGVYEIAQ